MADLVDLRIKGEGWDALSGPQALAERAARAALAEAGVSAGGLEIALLLTDDAEIARLNAQFRDKDAPTDVLSWPGFDLRPGDAPPSGPEDAPELLGDIALAAQTVARDAQSSRRALADHVAHLVCHGVLHLLGYDHGSEAEAEAMEGVERRALARIGVADPYA